MAYIQQQELYQSVLLAQQGDQAAFTKLVGQTQNLVTSTALAIVYDVQASEDVAQNTFVAVWQQLKELKSPDSFLPWLRQITRNKAKNYLRDSKVTRQTSIEESAAGLDSLVGQDSPADSLEQAQLQRKVADIVAGLPDENRDILILYYREQQSSVQVAKLLDLSESNVRQKLKRIRDSVKDELLSQVGEYLLSTAPTIAFTSLVTSAISGTAPVAAATLTAANTAQSSGIMKILSLLGGAMLGGLVAVAAIFFASHLAQRKLTDQEQKTLLKQRTRIQAAWVFICAVLFMLSYEIDDGWVGPVSVYTLLVIGLVVQQAKLLKLFRLGVIECPAKGYVAGWLGMLLGASVGAAGLIIGLVNSGRLVF